MAEYISRRNFLKSGVMAVGAIALADMVKIGGALAAPQAKAQVFFTRDISPEGLLRIYSRVNAGIGGKVAVKLHTGEPGAANLPPRELIRALQAKVPDSTLVETNTLYPGKRFTTEDHLETLKKNGWDFCPVDIMDAQGEASLPIPGMREFLDRHGAFGVADRPYTPGLHLTELSVGKGLLRYDSMLVYTHFKGHAMGGFGGSLKNIAIGCASGRGGKRQIHGDGFPGGELFMERMVEGGKAVADHFGPRITYINMLMNMSVDCDCNGDPAKPLCRDLGILASTDILAVDKASVDMVYALPEAERAALVERIESRKGLRQLSYMKTLNMGADDYELITL